MYQTPIYNNYGLSMPRQFPQMQRVKCFPVTSFDEVKSAMIDFDGSITVFTDFANGRIYTKNINNDGTANIGVYVLTQTPTEIDPLEARVNQLESALIQLKEEINNAGINPINADNTNESKSDGGATTNRRTKSANG